MRFTLTKLIIHCLFGIILSSGLVMAEWGGKGSFSPIYMTADNGKPLKLIWTYVVNEGKPLTFTEVVDGESVDLSLLFGDLKLSIDPKTLKREVKVSAKVKVKIDRRIVNGRVDMQVLENLILNQEGKTLVSDQNVDVNLRLSIAGRTARAIATVFSKLDPHSEWFLDRNDLDTLGIGYIYDEQGSVNATVKGDVCVKFMGQTQCEDIPEFDMASPERWEITNYSEQIQVRNSVYSNVVEVSRETLVPVFGSMLVEVPDTEQATTTYWVAKGIGMVKGYGQYQFSDKPLLIELKSTSITIPKISKLKRLVSRTGVTLKISGKGFGKTIGKVMIDGSEALVTRWSTNTIYANLPDDLVPGPHPVVIERDNGISSFPKLISTP